MLHCSSFQLFFPSQCDKEVEVGFPKRAFAQKINSYITLMGGQWRVFS